MDASFVKRLPDFAHNQRVSLERQGRQHGLLVAGELVVRMMFLTCAMCTAPASRCCRSPRRQQAPSDPGAVFRQQPLRSCNRFRNTVLSSRNCR
jgi:hypothetical protein